MGLILGDCLEKMKDIHDKSIDMILCDLPYGTTACKWDVIIPFDKLWNQYKRVAKDNSAIVLTARDPFTSLMVVSNIEMYKHKWVWNKKQSGSFQNAKYMPLQIDEDILVFCNGKVNYYPEIRIGKFRKRGGAKEKSRVVGSGLSDGYENFSDKYFPVNIIDMANERAGILHPTQKPVKLFEYLIKTYTNKGETVLDNCAGSGTTAIACMNTGRKYICIEKDKVYFELMSQRVAAKISRKEKSFLNFEITNEFYD